MERFSPNQEGIPGGYPTGQPERVGRGTPMGPLFKVKQQPLQIIDLIRFNIHKSCDRI